MSLEFWECSTCNAKPGTPTLCRGCLNNRTAISRLAAERDEALAKLKAYENLNHVGPESEWFPTGYVAGLKAKLAIALKRIAELEAK
jgi:hypothetical protein